MASRSAWTLAGLAWLLALGAAGAQENRLRIRQDGTGNQLTVNQAEATSSRVGGLTLGTASATAPLTLRGATRTDDALRGTAGGLDPQIVGATALTATPDRSDNSQALQSGNANTADVTVRGVGGFVGLQQNNLSGALGNDATISLNGDGTALVSQEGLGNGADLSVSGRRALGSILQRGSRNNAGLTVAGNGASGAISQLGDSNNSTLAVTSASGASVSYTVQGSGITNFNPLQGVDVTTNAASVSITQTAIGTGLR